MCCVPARFAYIEFIDKSSVTQALDLDDSLFKGRQIKVSQSLMITITTTIIIIIIIILLLLLYYFIILL